jgi:hypothetical protein
MHDDGRDMDQNNNKAMRWYRMAAEERLALAQNSMGLMFGKGRGVSR